MRTEEKEKLEERRKKWNVCSIRANIKPTLLRIMLNTSEIKPQIKSRDCLTRLKKQNEAISYIEEKHFKHKDISRLKGKDCRVGECNICLYL